MTGEANMGSNRCGSCRYWQRLSDGGGFASDRGYEIDDDEAGICRFNPPVGQRRDMPRNEDGLAPFASNAVMWAQWPVVDAEADWCGKYEAASGVQDVSTPLASFR